MKKILILGFIAFFFFLLGLLLFPFLGAFPRSGYCGIRNVGLQGWIRLIIGIIIFVSSIFFAAKGLIILNKSKIIGFILLGIILIGSLSIISLLLYYFISSVEMCISLDYYDNLRKEYCDELLLDQKDCCLGTIDTMEKYGYEMAENNTCPDNYNPIIASCEGSIPFCVPLPEPITSIEDCFKLTNEEGFFNPEVHSNIPKDEADYVNEETRKVDSCIYYFVDQHKEMIDDSVCEKIISPYYMYLCRQKIAIHLGDISLCNIEYLGKQSNVDGCLNHLSGSGYVDPDPHTEQINP